MLTIILFGGDETEARPRTVRYGIVTEPCFGGEGHSYRTGALGLLGSQRLQALTPENHASSHPNIFNSMFPFSKISHTVRLMKGLPPVDDQLHSQLNSVKGGLESTVRIDIAGFDECRLSVIQI